MSGDLLERLRAATGADRELDAAIVEAFGTSNNGIPACAGYVGIAAFTASLDAALALVERVLPERCVDLRKCDDGSGFATIRANDGTPDDADDELFAEAMAPTPALALLCALLSALPETQQVHS